MPQIVTSKNIFKLPDGKYPAGEGLLLFVRAASRTWIFRYQINGKRRDLSLGSAKTIPISSVRQKAQELKVLIANGIDPKEQRDNKNKEEDLIKTFDEVAKEAIDLFQVVRQWKNEKHAAQWRATISKHASPVIGKKKISEINRDDILNVLNPIWNEKTETASRIRGRLEDIFDFAISKKYCEENPARWFQNLESFLPSPTKLIKENHFAAIPLEKLKKIAPTLYSSMRISYLAVIFGTLTATRAQEFLGLEWSEIDFETNTWEIPIKRSKTHVPHRVPLSRQALDILNRIPRPSKYVFFSPITGKHLSANAPIEVIRWLTKQKFTMHGMRSTFRDWGEENLIHDTLLEKALSHSKKSKTVRAYQRSDLLEQRRPIMQMWADELLPPTEK